MGARSKPKIGVWKSSKMVFIATRLAEVTREAVWIVRSWARLGGSPVNNYQIIITTFLFLEASATMFGSPFKFTN